MNNKPSTYFEWSNTFDDLKRSIKDYDRLKELNNATLELDETLRIRFINLVDESVAFRLEKAMEKFVNSLRVNNTDVNTFNLNVIEFRNEIKFLFAICRLNVIPKENQDRLIASIRTQVKIIENTVIENCNAKDRTGTYANIIKNSNLSTMEG